MGVGSDTSTQPTQLNTTPSSASHPTPSSQSPSPSAPPSPSPAKTAGIALGSLAAAGLLLALLLLLLRCCRRKKTSKRKLKLSFKKKNQEKDELTEDDITRLREEALGKLESRDGDVRRPVVGERGVEGEGVGVAVPQPSVTEVALGECKRNLDDACVGVRVPC